MPKVSAWDLAQQDHAISIDKSRYAELLVCAIAIILKSFLSVDQKTLHDWLFSNAGYCSKPDYQLAGAD